jgi:hypothetical protein
MVKTTFIARIKRGAVDEPNGSFIIPASFGVLQDILSYNKSHPYFQLEKSLTSLFIPGNLSDKVPEFLLIDDEFNANLVSIENIILIEGEDLPIITATAEFILPTTHVITQEELDQWQEENELLDNAISFEWLLEPSNDKLASNVLTVYDELTFTVKPS